MPLNNPETTLLTPARNLRAAVVIPPICDFYFTRHRFASLGAHIVQKIITGSGRETKLFHFPAMQQNGTMTRLPSELSHLTPCLIEEETGRLSCFTGYRHFGPSIEQCASQIALFSPGVCFISLFAFAYAQCAIDLARALKKQEPGLPVIFGGAGPSVYPEYFMREPSIDMVLAGEAEAGLPALISQLSTNNPEFEKVPNLWHRRNGTISAPSLRKTAGDDRIEPVIVQSFESSKMIAFSTSLSRGCPGQCGFCSSHLTLGKEFRSVPLYRVSSALEEIAIDKGNSGKQIIINIEDDNILASHEYARSLISLINTRFPQTGIIAENGIDYSFLTPDLCTWLIHHGMKKFNLSLGTVSERVAKGDNRFLDLEHYEKIIGILDKNSVPTITYFICGLESDTIETTAEALAYLAGKRTLTGISLFYPVPGIAGYEDRLRFDAVSPALCAGSSAYPWNRSLSTESMITAFRLSRFGNLLKSGRCSEMENAAIEKIRAERKLFTVVNSGNGHQEITEVPRYDKDLVNLYFRLREKND